MNIKRIIREELDGLEWIKDTKSNQDIAQEIADETKIKNNRLYPPFSNPPFKLSSSFPLYPLAFASLIFRNYGKEQYGLDKEDANDVWERYKDIIKDKINDHNNLNENDDMEWIKDVKTNQDIAQEIAQEIADETKIKNNRLYHPPSSLNILFSHPSPSLHLSFLSLLFPHPLFRKYCKEQYGLDNLEDVNNVWKRYKDIVKDKINDHSNINESNDLQWVKDTIPTLEDALYNRLLKVGDIVTLSGKLVDLEHKKRIDTDNFKVKIEKLGSLIYSSDFTPLQKEYWGHLGYEDEPLRFAKEDGEMSVVSIE